jgi:DNA-directed RNA polymerase subunit RPC12/RpoP
MLPIHCLEYRCHACGWNIKKYDTPDAIPRIPCKQCGSRDVEISFPEPPTSTVGQEVDKTVGRLVQTLKNLVD